MGISIRLEEQRDFGTVENIIREAFWNVYKPGCDEHLIVHKMRAREAFVKELAFVACDGAEVVGCIVYSRAKVVDGEGGEHEVLCMGPIAVMPARQGQGIGSMLMNHSIERARQLGYKGVIIFGNPGYYHRFGYKNAAQYGIQTSTGDNFDPFMALELAAGSLDGVSGRFREDDVFKVNAEELEIYEKGFPYKEKLVTDTQLKL